MFIALAYSQYCVLGAALASYVFACTYIQGHRQYRPCLRLASVMKLWTRFVFITLVLAMFESLLVSEQFSYTASDKMCHYTTLFPNFANC